MCKLGCNFALDLSVKVLLLEVRFRVNGSGLRNQHLSMNAKTPPPGIEPGSSAWQAEILTTILQRIGLNPAPSPCQMFWRITNLLIAGDGQDGLLIIVCLPAKCSMKQHSGIQKALPGRPKERVWDNVHTRSRTWVVAATTRHPNH